MTNAMKKLFNRHEHNFRKTGNNLYCSCGEIKRMECDHKWKLHKEEGITRKVFGGDVKQVQQTLICKACGDIKFINTTCGQEEKNNS